MAPNLKNIRFGRRKSQGNSIEDGSPTAPVSSFRVIPREDTARKSTSNALDLRKAATFQPTRQSSYEYDSGSSNRGSNSSASTAPRSHLFDNPNTRFSSTSTLQSPVEAMKKDRSPSPHFLKLGDDFDSDWGDLFVGGDKRKSGLLDDSGSRPLTLGARTESEPILSNPPKAFSHTQRLPNPSPPLGYGQFGHRRQMTASPPTQWARRNSKDRLISSPELDPVDSPTDDMPPPPPPKHTSAARGSKPYTYFQLPEDSDVLDEPPMLGHTASVRSQNSFTRSGAEEDVDAAFVRQSVRDMRASTLERSGAFESSPLARKEMNTSDSLAPPTSRPLNNSSDISLKTTSSSSSATYDQKSSASPSPPDTSDSARSTPRAAPVVPADEEVGMFDPEVMQAIHQVNTRQLLGLPTESPASPARPSAARVMSMAEFNKQTANARHTTPQKPADDDSDDGYEDDDDDPVIQAQKRRIEAQKEAQHAVWRQKMKKAIGDHSSLPPMRPDISRANQSAPSLMFNGEPQPDDEEDDDVPLAILQAHNFPGKNKAPDSRMSQSSYVGVQDRPDSPARQSVAGQRASQLPVFARRLPEDPYFGSADLSAPSNRESMAFNKSRSQSVHGGASGPPPGTSPVPGIPPGGLVGVIAEEERERRARRGSPNAQAAMGYNMPGVGNMGGSMQMPMGPGSPMGQQDAIRNQQMLELMQQNSFMMKEMMEMRAQMQMFQMGGSPMPQGMPMPGLPPQSRPMSMADQNSSRRSVTPSTMYGRTMSFMGPAPNMFMNQQASPGASGAMSVRNMPVGNFGPLNGYTPSIAPSERSNIGQPSRYKPVNLGDGGSTVTAGSTPKLSQVPTATENKKSGFLSAMVHSGRKSMSRAKDDDDDEEWSAPRRRR